jgi:type II secretory pathway predicted ATPase ExeA
MQSLNHLKLVSWPFKIIPDEQSASFWADRNSAKEQIERLLWNWDRRDQSNICILWGTLGSGKSHIQKYLFKRLSSNHNILPIYALMPKEIRNFLDVYKVIMGNIQLNELGELIIQIDRDNRDGPKADRVIFPLFSDVANVL